MSRDVFVSYSQPDRDCAMEVVSHLESHGISTWVAPRDVSPLADWAAEIIEAISAARIMVLVFSASCNASAQVRREVERAVHKRVRVLPFRVEDVLPSKSLEYFLSAQHWMDAFPLPRGPHYDRLCSFLDIALSPTGVAAPGPSGSVEVNSSSARPRAVDPAQLRHLERDLARFIGPVAGLMVRRATADSVDLEQLTIRLATELDTEHDRQQFINACHQLDRLRP